MSALTGSTMKLPSREVERFKIGMLEPAMVLGDQVQNKGQDEWDSSRSMVHQCWWAQASAICITEAPSLLTLSRNLWTSRIGGKAKNGWSFQGRRNTSASEPRL